MSDRLGGATRKSTDFLLELRSEEIPARMQARAREDMARLFAGEIAKSGVTATGIGTFATPRRLALVARGLPEETAAQSEERKGPRTSAPEAALAGFLRSTGLTRDQLTERDGIWFARIEKPGRAIAYVLAEAVPAIIRAFPWPKSMRWGDASGSTESLRWVRPLQGIIALLGETIVPCEIDGIESGATTLGHRFHHPGPITIGSAADYVEKLRACHVIVDPQERATIIRDGARAAAAGAGLTLVEDEDLVGENAGLTEWPVPLLGRFDEAYLAVPPEVIQLTMRTNQKYFACSDGVNLAPAFICTANIDAADSGTSIVAGNQRVLAARLSDAKFFWEADLKIPLAEQAKKLSGIVFHEKLWSLDRKSRRVATIAADWLPEKLGWSVDKARALQPALRQAASLAKADLVTAMVGEFPELQGVIGGYYAEAEGLPVAAAIRDHYKPQGPNDDLPADEIGVIVALADKADTLYSFFLVGERPTGSKDPYALRRAGLGIVRLILEKHLRVSLSALFDSVDYERAAGPSGVDWSNPRAELVAFIIDRLKVQQREAGVRHDIIDAVFALGGEDDLVRLLARVRALQAFVETPDGANLLAGYRRAANILKKENHEPAPQKPLSYSPEPAEARLILALDMAEPCAAAAIAREDFEGAMAALAGLRVSVDAFFETVTVNDPDAVKRATRLALLARIRDAVYSVADFSRIEG